MESLMKTYIDFANNYSSDEAAWEFVFHNIGRNELRINDFDEGSKKVAFRSYEKTPSVSIKKGLYFVDYGSDGEGHPLYQRVIDIMDCTRDEAIATILDWENSLPEEFKNKKHNIQVKESKKPYTIKYIRKMVLNKKKYQNRYLPLTKGLFRGLCSDAEVKMAEKLLNIGFAPKDQYQSDDRIFIPEFSLDQQAYGSYKYNKNILEKKGLLRAGAKRILFGENLLPKYGKDLILSEGHTDTVMNVAKKTATLTSGSATKQLGDNISKLAGKHIHIFYDLDLAGMIGATRRALEIEEWNKNQTDPYKHISYTIYWWSQWFVSKKIATKIADNKIEKNDIFEPLKNDIPIKKEHACFNIDLLQAIQYLWAKKKKVQLKDNMKISNWKIVSVGAKQEGFDFIDFHTEFKPLNPIMYEKFLEKFRF